MCISYPLTHCINFNGFLYAKQFGIGKRHSTSHALITSVERLSTTLDTGKIVDEILLDNSKVFDYVRHSTLIDEHYKINIHGSFFLLRKSYLLSRTQYVHYHWCNSSIKPIQYRVPQGSVLEQLLFKLFMNDFCRTSQLLFSILFADDTSVFLIDKKINSINKITK